MSRYFKYILLFTFLSAILVIVFLQFNSNRSINQLIDGNEDLLEELNIKNNIQELQTGIITLENKVKSTVIEGKPAGQDFIKQEVANIRLSMTKLDTLQNDQVIAPLILQLNSLVNSKIILNIKVLDTLSINGKISAEQFINKKYGKHLTDSIKLTAAQIDDLHQRAVTKLIQDADNNGRSAKTWGTIMALMATIASIFTFGYVAHKVRQQQALIFRLNESEKKVRDAANVKEKFLANMSHEIRTPLNAILGFTNLVKKKSLDPEVKEHVEVIHKSGENLLNIVNDILDLSKIEAGMMRIETAPFSIRRLVDPIMQMFKEKIAEKQLNFYVDIDSEIPDMLEGDANRLSQVLINLVGNAIKFTSKGSIRLKICCEQNLNGIIKTGITVTDTGIGVERNQLHHIFGRFHQAEDSVTRKYGGTGLGLSIVADLVRLQNGSIELDSEPGVGTAFHIMIPYKICDQQSYVNGSADIDLLHAHSFEKLKILVAEDNLINQSLLKHIFNNWELNFDIANNGKEAIELLGKNQYNLVLMDIQMPEMDGYTATQAIRNELKLNIPIIAMTAHALEGERKNCLSYGMNEYISKPIIEAQLHHLISRFAGITEMPVLESSNKGTAYQTIDLSYMREVSGGNMDYEKTVTQQFIEIIPGDLQGIEKAWQNKDLKNLRQLVHNMKTTISVMGLNELLRPYLDSLEYDELNETSFRNSFDALQSFCNASVQEANHFYATL
ncbi:MAG: response regulator [Ferruginibacter sp.]